MQVKPSFAKGNARLHIFARLKGVDEALFLGSGS
jgi:hypothetical protein